MEELENCPNCDEKLKGGMMSSNKLLGQEKVAVINEYHSEKSKAYCEKCGKDLFKQYSTQLSKEQSEITQLIRNKIGAIPVISAHSPLNWDYRVLRMVSGQSTTGTGVISEFTSSFSDLFGGQAGRYNTKLKAGENLCYAQLRKQTLDAGGNAVIATDIDYSELGSLKGMIMVCMAGTAVELNNPDVLGEQRSNVIKELVDLNKRHLYLSRLGI